MSSSADTVMRRVYRLPRVSALTAAALFAVTGAARATELDPPDSGFIIELKTPNGVAQKSGQSARITGQVKFTGKLHKISGGDGNGKDKGKSDGKGSHTETLQELFTKRGVSVQANFPDYTNPVPLTLDSQGRFTYDSAALRSEDLNQFIVQVTKTTPEARGLEKVLSKLDLRIAGLQTLIQKLNAEHASPDLIAAVERKKALFKTVSDRIAAKLAAREELMAETRLPLQIDNKTSGPGYASTVMGKFRHAVTFAVGSAFEGTTQTAVATVTNLRKTSDSIIWERDEEDGEEWEEDDLWLARFQWDGTLVKTIGPMAIPPGQSVSFTYPTPKLLPENLTTLSSELYAWDTEDKEIGKRFAHLALKEPVAGDSVAPSFAPGSSPSPANRYVKSAESIVATVSDPFGRIDPSAIKARLKGQLVDGSSVDRDITPLLILTPIGDGEGYLVTADYSALGQGEYTSVLTAADYAGNLASNPAGGAAELRATFRVDRTPPQVVASLSADRELVTSPETFSLLGIPGTHLTNATTVTASATIIDLSPTQSVCALDGTTLTATNATSFQQNVDLKEGINHVTIDSVDAAGNASAPQTFVILRDTTVPQFVDLKPAQGAIFQTLAVLLSSRFSEPVRSVRVNGVEQTLSADHRSFSGTLTTAVEGSLPLAFEIADLAGNISRTTRDVQIILKVLNGNLLAVAPDEDGIHLVIRGAPYATRPGLTVSASSGFFNNGSAVAGADGSFTIRMKPFQDATVTATDPGLGRTESAAVHFNLNTRLSGVIRDTDGLLLSGVTVSIAGSGLTTVTDASGVFSFDEPVTGDQALVIDGTTVPQSVRGPLKAYSKVSISISVGLLETNVLRKPISLSPIRLDGSGTPVSVDASATVTSPRAPGVKLEIPAGVSQFPGGSGSGTISVETIPAEFTTVPPPDFAVPTKVTTFEPSGLRFKDPVPIQFPNDNALPVGTEMAIFSMNSSTGKWEVDGIASVSQDGSSVVSKPGKGITHFSTVYAVPVSPEIRHVGSPDRPGANTFDGALSASVRLPSYKSFGQDIGTTLLYKSSWARPTALISNSFDLTQTILDLTRSVEFDAVLHEEVVKQVVKKNYCVPGPGGVKACYSTYEAYRSALEEREISEKVTSTYAPERITAQFMTTGITGEKASFSAPEARTMISYSLDLKDPATGEYLGSGIYPYLSRYEIHLKNLVMHTRPKSLIIRDLNHLARMIPKEEKDQLETPKTIDQMIPSDVTGNIFVQNESKSAAGAGWRIAGNQRIVNPTEERPMIEEADGSISTYALKTTITTVFQETGSSGFDLSHGVHLAWPMLYARSGGAVFGYDMQARAATQFPGAISDYSGQVRSGMGEHIYVDSVGNTVWDWMNCVSTQHPYRFQSTLGQLAVLPNGSVFATDLSGHRVFRLFGGTAQPLVGGSRTVDGHVFTFPDTSNPPHVKYSFIPDNRDFYREVSRIAAENYCQSTMGISCPMGNFDYNGPFWHEHIGETGFLRFHDGNLLMDACYSQGLYRLPAGQGSYPVSGFADGSSDVALLNSPYGVSAGPRDNTLVIADYGNHRVRLLDLNANSIQTIAGNGQVSDSGDGGFAANAGIFHPRSAIYDSAGNLYITNDSGLVRKVDTTGRISTLVGGPNAMLRARGNARDFLLHEPTGMVVDNDRAILYVADTGNHRVVGVDLMNGIAVTVAGINSPGYNGDDQSSLNAALFSPTFLGLDDKANLLIVDSGNSRIRRVNLEPQPTGHLSYSPSAPDNTSLARNGDGTWTRYYPNGVTVYFDSQGRQSSISDRLGNVTRWNYDGSGRVASRVDAAGRATLFSYSGNRLSTITDPAARTTTFEYTGDFLMGVTFPDGTIRKFGYNAAGLLETETNERGKVTKYEYNSWNRLTAVVHPDNSATQLIDAGSASVGNSFINGTVGSPKSAGPLIGDLADRFINSKGAENVFEKDVNGYVSTITDSEGEKIKVIRDSDGKPRSIRRYDLNGNEVSKVTFEYDSASGLLLSQTDSATGITTSQTYDSYGSPLSQTNGRGFTTAYEYFGNGLLKSATDPLGRRLSSTYSPMGLVVSTTNPQGKTTNFTYDSSGNLSTVTDPLGHVTTYGYDAAGNLRSMTNAKNQMTSYEYDTRNRLTAVITPKQERTEYSYFATGELRQIKDPLGNFTSFEYDDLGRLTKKTDPLGFVTTRQYDDQLNTIQETDPNGNVKTFEYDKLNRLKRKLLPDDVITLEYDSSSKRMKTLSSTQSEISYGYDLGGRLTAVRSRGLGDQGGLPDTSLTFTLDENGNRKTRADPSGTSSYQFDSGDRLTALTNPKAEVFQYAFNDATGAVSLSRPGSTSSLTVDDAGLTSTIVHSANGSVVASFALQRDPTGNLTRISRGGLDRVFAYDDNSQLTSASNPEASSTVMQAETFRYDAVFNRATDQSGSYTYEAKKQRLLEDYRYFYFYDNNGNLTSKQAKGLTGEVTNFTYTSENQLRQFKVYEPGSVLPVKEVTYAYDALGRRVEKRVIDHRAEADTRKTFTRRYVYDGAEVLLEYDGGNSLLARYTHSMRRMDDVLAVDVTQAGVGAGLSRSPGSYQYLKDAQGSVTDVLDNGGNKVQHYVYAAFGALLGVQDAQGADATAAPPLATSYGFTGREHDSESGLIYCRARYYDPGVGRFLQKDPDPGSLRSAATIANSYAYVGNEPVGRADPTGQLFEIFSDLSEVHAYVVLDVLSVPLPIKQLGIQQGLSRIIGHIMNPMEGLQNAVAAIGIAAWATLAIPAWLITGEAPGISVSHDTILFRGGFESFATSGSGPGSYAGVTPSGWAGFVSATDDHALQEVQGHESHHTSQSAHYGPFYLIVAPIYTRQNNGCNWFEAQADPNIPRNCGGPVGDPPWWARL